MGDITNGVTFGDKHSYNDWGLYLRKRPEISPPNPKTTYIDIPGADGSIDMTEALTGEVRYEDRTIKCEFTVLDARTRWSNIYSEIMDYLHGQRMKIIFDEDQTYYYEGRLQVNKWESSEARAFITIEGTCEPYKMELASSLEDWEWDPFNFETGIIRDYANLEVDGTLTLEIVGTRKSVIPIITVSADMTVTFEGETYDLTKGTNKISDIVIVDGTNTLVFTGTGTVSVEYRGGRL